MAAASARCVRPRRHAGFRSLHRPPPSPGQRRAAPWAAIIRSAQATAWDRGRNGHWRRRWFWDGSGFTIKAELDTLPALRGEPASSSKSRCTPSKIARPCARGQKPGQAGDQTQPIRGVTALQIGHQVEVPMTSTAKRPPAPAISAARNMAIGVSIIAHRAKPSGRRRHQARRPPGAGRRRFRPWAQPPRQSAASPPRPNRRGPTAFPTIDAHRHLARP